MSRKQVNSPAPDPDLEEIDAGDTSSPSRGKPQPQRKPGAWGADGERADKEPTGTGAAAAGGAAKGAEKEAPKEEPKPPPPPKRLPGDPKRVSFYEDQEDIDTPDAAHDVHDPHFYMGAATVIGMASFTLFLAHFMSTYGELVGELIWIVTFAGGGAIFLVPFMYYLATSKHPSACCGRLMDGLVGALPYLPIGCGVMYMYTVLGLTCKNAINAEWQDKLLVFACIPLFMVLWIPMFYFMLRLQNTESEKKTEEEKRKEAEEIERERQKGKGPPPNYGKHPWKISVLAFQRMLFGGVVACCITAYCILPLLVVGYACYGMYLAWEIHIAIPICILAVLLIFIVVGLFCFPRGIRTIGKGILGFYTYPFTGWGTSAKGPLLPRYDNSLTLDRRVDGHNSKIDRMEKLRSKGKAEEANQLAAEIKQYRKKLEEDGANLVEEVVVEVPPEQQQQGGGQQPLQAPGRRGGGGRNGGMAASNDPTSGMDVESI